MENLERFERFIESVNIGLQAIRKAEATDEGLLLNDLEPALAGIKDGFPPALSMPSCGSALNRPGGFAGFMRSRHREAFAVALSVWCSPAPG